jgi:GTP diphosphokinase / guanosine-3',5'-bis(diphosphate) 3'-diphosphatase
MRRLAVDLGERQETILQLFNSTNWDDFLAALGYGGISTNSITRKLGAFIQEEEARAEPPPALPEKMAPAQLGGPGLRVLGVGNLLTTMARCCHPVPGDQIVGYVTRTRGVTVHRADCLNVLNEDEQERLVEVEWGTASKLYPVSVRIEAWDRVGLLRDITTVVTDDKVNMVGVRTLENDDGSVSILATLETTGIEQLSRLLSRIEIIRGVRTVERATEHKRGKGETPTPMKRSGSAG